MYIRTTSEWQAFIDTMNEIGVDYTINWKPQVEDWQEIINSEGFNITAHAIITCHIGSVAYVFSTGKPFWLGDHEDGTEQGFGCQGTLLLVYDTSEKKVISRVYKDHTNNRTFTGVKAVAKEYDFFTALLNNPPEK